jgi:hypothetical protein
MLILLAWCYLAAWRFAFGATLGITLIVLAMASAFYVLIGVIEPTYGSKAMWAGWAVLFAISCIIAQRTGR